LLIATPSSVCLSPYHHQHDHTNLSSIVILEGFLLKVDKICSLLSFSRLNLLKQYIQLNTTVSNLGGRKNGYLGMMMTPAAYSAKVALDC
jgi:hypothetical protein